MLTPRVPRMYGGSEAVRLEMQGQAGFGRGIAHPARRGEDTEPPSTGLRMNVPLTATCAVGIHRLARSRGALAVHVGPVASSQVGDRNPAETATRAVRLLHSRQSNVVRSSRCFMISGRVRQTGRISLSA